MRRRFWNWSPPPTNEVADLDAPDARVLHIDGVIAEQTWFDDDITPALFAEELHNGSCDITVWINSPGGDVVAAAQIYNMLRDYPGSVTVRIDGLAASAASVIAMAGETVVMSPVSMLMIHNPATMAVGDKDELGRAITMLDSVKESIINAYQAKTGLSRAKLAKLMDAETWMDARAAFELGFADEIDPPLQGGEAGAEPVVFDQMTLGSYKLGTFLKISEELLNDSAFNIESYLSGEFGRRIGAAEEEAFLTGDGTNKPTEIFTTAEEGLKASAATTVTADELIDLQLPVSQERGVGDE